MKYFIFLFILHLSLTASRIGDIANIVGVRDNQLIGYGLIVGLGGTGDSSSSIFTLQSLANMLQTMNVAIDPNAIKSKNIAAVIITTSIDAFARQGDKLTINVSSIGDAKSLEGGTLVLTPLKGVDGKIYALAQGSLTIGGRNTKGKGRNHSTAGMIFNGGTVERELTSNIYQEKTATLSLKQSNFANVMAIEKEINKIYKTKVATAVDPRTIKLTKPPKMSMIEFLANIEDVNIQYKIKEKIIINERTGTIVAGVNILISPVIITHGDITIKIEETTEVPEATVNTIRLDENIAIGLQDNRIKVKKGKNTVANITRSLQKLGTKPKDIISILEAIKQAGALQADIDII